LIFKAHEITPDFTNTNSIIQEIQKQKPARGGLFAKQGVENLEGFELYELVELLGKHLAANTLIVALCSGGFLALTLGCGFLIKLTGTKIGQETILLDGALKAAQCHFKWFVFAEADGGHAVFTRFYFLIA
jgi:hypothetical protein